MRRPCARNCAGNGRKASEKSETLRDRGSRFLKMLIHEMQLLNDRPPTVKAERKAKCNRRLRKMNGVGWLQKSAVCGKIDSYGASQGHFRCKSGRGCHAGGRFHVLISQRMSSGFARRALYYPPTISHFARAFISTAGDFTPRACFCIVADDFVRHASFYIARRCVRTSRVLLHCPPMRSHITRALTSPADGFARHACFSINRR